MVFNSPLLLDFDGVLCDSREECLVVSYRAFLAVTKQRCVNGFDLSSIPADLASRFRVHRFLVRVAREYALLWQLLTDGKDLVTDRPLTEHVSWDEGQLENYREAFFDERKKWQKESQASWFLSNPLYAGIGETLRNPAVRDKFLIVSSKDETAMESILRHHDIPVQRKQLFGAETRRDKEDLLKEIMAASKPVSFLDDNLQNVMTAQRLGLKPALAGWGYNQPSERIVATEKGIPILPLERFSDWVFRRLSS